MSCIILHAGLGEIKSVKKRNLINNVLVKIIDQAYVILMKDGSRSAVLSAVKLLEDFPLFNAGTGSKLQNDGIARMSASIMSSEDGKFNAVINISRVKNPIEIANRLHNEKDQVLASEGAVLFARSIGIPIYDPITKERLNEFNSKKKSKNGTVGAIAVDEKGIICVGSSTGGIGNENVGRVSDTPTIAGLFVNKTCGVIVSGIGEHIINLGVANKICNLAEFTKDLNLSSEIVIQEGLKKTYTFGIIGLSLEEEIHIKTTSEELFYAYKNNSGTKTFNS